MLPLPLLQELPHELTLEQAQSAACQPLVADMVTLLGRLRDLSHLEDAGEQQVSREQGDNGAGGREGRGCQAEGGQHSCVANMHAPCCAVVVVLQDAALTWFAANFMQQKHPLGVAMQQQVRCGGVRSGRPCYKAWPSHHSLSL
jgi:hypothetical protein